MERKRSMNQRMGLLSLLVLVSLLVILVPGTGAAKSEWTWMSGTNTVNQTGTYGTKGTAHEDNVPGARDRSISWRDGAGNLWLFGGDGYVSASSQGRLNDLWRYDATTGWWTWMSGANTVNQSGVYGDKGTAHPDNVPGGRYGSISWRDSAGDLWLFGGTGYDSTRNYGPLNDLWRYNPTGGLWTWVSGANTRHQLGVYGTQGTAHADNVPGARYGSISWLDSAGDLWLFGGDGYGASSSGRLNDLWRYDPDSGWWTWMSGATTPGQKGIYGTRGTAAAANVPGARQYSISWRDGAGNLWLLGGFGESAGNNGHLNDLWRYGLTTGWWTWMSGANAANRPGVYGTQGTPDAGNVPGARRRSISWLDSAGNLWLLGGYGYGAPGFGYLNDLWRYDPASGTYGTWTWMSGANTVNQPGVYGTQGTPAATNVPGGRQYSVSWLGGAGNLWLFGGDGYDSAGTGRLNDLWRYELQSPTAVTLASFRATAAGDAILVEWETASEMDTEGFYLYRNEAGDGLSAPGTRERLNGELIPGQGQGSLGGASYSWLDEAAALGVVYDYWLEEVDVHGRTATYGPERAGVLVLAIPWEELVDGSSSGEIVP